ncbi:hypothetical protein ES703_50416 [subsurface metagenome]
MNKVAIIIVSLTLAMALGLSGCVTISPPSPAAPPPEALAPPTTTATIHMSEPCGGGLAVGALPIYLYKGQQLYLSFRGIQHAVVICLIPPDLPEGFHNFLGYQSSTGWGGDIDDPSFGHLELGGVNTQRSGRFIYQASESGFHIVKCECARSNTTEADCEIQYEVR